MHSYRWFAIPIALALAACGGSGIDANADNVCSEVAKVACHNMYRCCSEGEIENFLGVDEPRTEAECTADISKLCQRSVAALDFAIEENRVRFDAEIMNRCLEALEAPSDTCATVSDVLPWAEECLSSAWVGIVADGGKCLQQLECGADSFCAPTQVCTARAKGGEACTRLPCAGDFFCDGAVCQDRRAAGAACTSSAQCEQPLFCDTTAAVPVCAALREPGERCTGDASCKSRECIPGTCSNSGFQCTSNDDCDGRCTDNLSSCTSDAQCGGRRRCSGTGALCTMALPPDPEPCPVGQTCCPAAQTCDAVTCTLDQCEGDIVCAENLVLVDYCQGAIGDLPIPGPIND